jgi:hypothetical protein
MERWFEVMDLEMKGLVHSLNKISVRDGCSPSLCYPGPPALIILKALESLSRE